MIKCSKFKVQSFSFIVVMVLTSITFIGCQPNSDRLFNKVKQLAGFEKNYKPELIQYGKEEGVMETIFEYSIFTIDSLSFKELEKSINSNSKITKGKYYLNIELDNYIIENNLKILNLNNSVIYENQFDEIYQVYLLSDRKSFVVCRID